MGLFGSSGKSHKRQAEAYLRTANNIQDYQNEVEFRRQMLSNIRQERIARAQLAVRDYSPTYRSSTNEGFVANLESSLAGETDFSYGSSLRSQRITDLNVAAAEEYRKYSKKQKQRAMVGSVAGTVVGAVAGAMTGGFGLGLTTAAGGMFGGQVGQGVGQILSNTGVNQTNAGIKNIISGIGFGYRSREMTNLYKNKNSNVQTPTGYGNYETFGINPTTGKYIPNTYAAWMLPQDELAAIRILGGDYVAN